MSTRIMKAPETMSKRDILRITSRDDVIPMKEVTNNTVITVKGYVLQEITKDRGDNPTGEKFNSILVLDENDVLYATRSETFINKFFEIMTLLEDDPEPVEIKISQLKSRNGNLFVSCALA